jgi:hypothetical protein
MSRRQYCMDLIIALNQAKAAGDFVRADYLQLCINELT